MLADYHHVAANKAEAAALALSAGLDVELPGTDCYGDPLVQAIQSDHLGMDTVDEAVRRFGKIDILINSAGFRGPLVPVTPSDPPKLTPIAEPIAAISSSAWNVITLKFFADDKACRMSLAGVIG